MDYDNLEVEIVGVLKDYFSATVLSEEVLLNTVFDARQFPENPTELLQNYDKALVNVAYTDSVYSDTKSNDRIIQDEEVIVQCYIQCSSLKGASGGKKLLKHVKHALMGYKPAEATSKMTIAGYGDWNLVSHEGELRPMIEFKFRTVNMQVRADTVVGTIDSDDTVSEGGPLLEVDSDLYAPPETDVIGEDNVPLK